MTKKGILIIDDSQMISQSLATKALPEFSVQVLPSPEKRTMEDIRTYLQARLRPGPDGGKSLRLDDHSGATVIGLNVHLACLPHRPGQRSLCHGIKLLKWLREKHALSSPVVLWSFLDERDLKLEDVGGPGGQIVYLPLPASLSSIQAAFEKAASATGVLKCGSSNSLALSSQGQIHRRPAPPVNQESNVRQDLLAGLLELKVKYDSFVETLSFAINALGQGSASELCQLVASDSWRRFNELVQNIEKILTQKGISYEELKEVSRNTTHITSFRNQCDNGRAIQQSQLRQSADHYRDCAAILQASLLSLTNKINPDSV